ncbi:hypothetical protein ACWEV9_10425 [Streptomyces albogriseolus]
MGPQAGDGAPRQGTGTFGAGLARYLLAQQVEVYEVNRPDRCTRRLLGKSDPLDAQAAARAVLSGRARARAKSGDGPVHSARMFKLAKDSAVKARTQAINQLKAVLVIADPAPRERLSSLGNRELFRTCARLGPGDGEDGEKRGGPGHAHDPEIIRCLKRYAAREVFNLVRTASTDPPL